MAESGQGRSPLIIVLIVLGVIGGGVVICGGVLAAIAIPAFVKFTNKSKEAEARTSLRGIADGVRQHHEMMRLEKGTEGGAFPPSVGLTPPRSCCDFEGDKCAVDPEIWSAEPWKTINFQPYGPHYYQYSMENKGDTLVIKAVGDLDCDGETSELLIDVKVGADGEVTISPPYDGDPSKLLE